MAQNYTSIDGLVQKHNEMKYGAGSISKEFDIPTPSLEIDELEKPTEQKTSLGETNEYVTPHTETINLPPDLKKIGVKTEDEDQFKEAMNKVKLPISDDRIMEDLKASPSESRRWFATILLYILERAHLTLRKVGTKVVRIFKTN